MPIQISSDVVDLIGGGGWIRTSDLRIMSSSAAVDNKENQSHGVAECGKSRQNPHTGRTQK
jgi:hypothetical protein